MRKNLLNYVMYSLGNNSNVSLPIKLSPRDVNDLKYCDINAEYEGFGYTKFTKKGAGK